MTTARIANHGERTPLCTVKYRTRDYSVNGTHIYVWATFDTDGEVMAAADHRPSPFYGPELRTTVLIGHREARRLLYQLEAP